LRGEEEVEKVERRQTRSIGSSIERHLLSLLFDFPSRNPIVSSSDSSWRATDAPKKNPTQSAKSTASTVSLREAILFFLLGSEESFFFFDDDDEARGRE